MVSNLSFSATLPPFSQTTGYVSHSSQANIAATGNLGITNTTDPLTGRRHLLTVTSNVTSNGINFTGTSSQLNGDLLTVNYTSDNAANSGQDSAITSQLLKTNISGSGVNFVETSSTSHEGIGRASYNTEPNAAYTTTVQNAAVSSETTDNSAENIFLKSYAQVGNTISITYQVSNGSLSNNTVLANSQVPEQTPSSCKPQRPIIGASAAPELCLGHRHYEYRPITGFFQRAGWRQYPQQRPTNGNALAIRTTHRRSL